jgi:hypothetical protein
MPDVRPDFKQATGAKPKRRRRATPAEWRQLHAAKGGPCRVCGWPGRYELHHLIARARGGADTFDNLVPLCRDCHRLVTDENSIVKRALAAALTDGEYAYLIGKLGENALERLFGVAA